MFIPLTGKRELKNIDYFVIWVFLVFPEQSKVLDVLYNIFNTPDELTYLVFLGIKQDPT